MSSVKKAAHKSLIWLGAIVVAMFGSLALGVFTNNTTWAPGLGLDLAGGRQIILTPEVTNDAVIDQDDLNQAVAIIRNRVDATGVSEAEISTQYPNIVVTLPGEPDQATVDMVRESAQLQFRTVLVTGAPTPVADTPAPTVSPSVEVAPSVEPSPAAINGPSASASPTPTQTESSASLFSEVAATPEASAAPISNATTEPAPLVSPSAAPTAQPAPVVGETDPSSFEWVTPELAEEFGTLNCLDPVNLAGRDLGNPDTGHVACDQFGQAKYILGPVEMSGNDLKTATAGPEMTQQGTLTGRYEVRLEFASSGASKFADITKRISTLESPRDQFAIVLDGAVISAAQVSEEIPGGKAQITGTYTQDEAQQLANQLKFGALPLTFTVQSDQQISATLGAEQLQSGLIAGAIGLILVFIYSLFQYRALGLVTMGSLLLAGVVTFAVISLLSWGIGYRLSLAGVAGLIVAIGITADSFIVYFERVRDELREGRSLQSAIDHAWKRARRTILASDAISLLAAIVLYTFAVGGVRGFAFTLGLTTIVDIVVVFLFTHPVLVLLSRRKFFSEGHRFSGFDPKRLGRDTMYKGRGRVASPTAPATALSGTTAPNASKGDGLTLAERKAAAKKAAQPTASGATEAQVTAVNAADGDTASDKAASAEGEK